MPSTLPYKVVATDLDGTLLNPQHRVSDYTLRVLDALAAKGVAVVLATGRHPTDVLETRRKLGLKGYVITSNGACVHDPHDRILLEKDIDPGIAKELVLLGSADKDVATSVYRGDSWFINKHAKDLTEYYQVNKHVFYYKLFDPEKADYDHVYKVYYTSDYRERLDALYETISTKYHNDVIVMFVHPNCLEVMQKGVNKGAALKDVVDILFGNQRGDASGDAGSLIKDCIVFGDGPNDVEMLTMAEKGCIMANAQQDLLKVAPPHLEKIGKNSEDGVARYLADLFGLDVEN